MRSCFLIFCLPLTFLPSASGQTSGVTAFQMQAQSAVSQGTPFHEIRLSASAEWVMGSSHESGTAVLDAKNDGSASAQVNLGTASRSETYPATSPDRSCQWTDSSGVSHTNLNLNCLITIPWFAASLFTQPAAQLPTQITITDDGLVTRIGKSFHQVSYRTTIQSVSPSVTKQIIEGSKVLVLYDPQTHLPARLEYSLHADNNDLANIPVTVLYSDYQSVSGVMLPFHLEKYVNRTLQLTLNVTEASVN